MKKRFLVIIFIIAAIPLLSFDFTGYWAGVWNYEMAQDNTEILEYLFITRIDDSYVGFFVDCQGDGSVTLVYGEHSDESYLMLTADDGTRFHLNGSHADKTVLLISLDFGFHEQLSIDYRRMNQSDVERIRQIVLRK